jgi:Na+/H+-dicarboxylate symporter
MTMIKNTPSSNLFLLSQWFKLPQWQQIIIGLMAGILTGLILQSKAHYLLPIGTIFIHAIQMLVVPVVVTAIVCAVISLADISKMGRIITKALLLYGMTMMISASIGIIIAQTLGVGHDFPMNNNVIAPAISQQLTLGDVLVSFIPTSSVAAFASNNVMQILCFSFIFGIALRLAGEQGKPVRDIFLSLSEVVFLFAKIVVGFAPYGVFALIACVTGQYGMVILLPLVKFVGAVYFSCALLIMIVFSILLLINRINPLLFFKKITGPLITAFTTSSSAATLPVTMRCARENLKIHRNLSDFLLPLGTTLNLNGLAIYLSVATIFAANMYHITLNGAQYMSMVITIVFTAAGAAAIPGSGLIVMSAVMTSVGIPLAAMPIIAGVDRFNDMAQTMTNVAGDLFAATMVAKSEKMIETTDSVPMAAHECTTDSFRMESAN